MRVGFDPKKGTIKTDAGNLDIDRGFLAHYSVSAAKAVAESDTGVMALTKLTDAVQSITTGLTSPAVPRNVKADASSSITTKVKVYGTNRRARKFSVQFSYESRPSDTNNDTRQAEMHSCGNTGRTGGWNNNIYLYFSSHW